MLEIFIVRRNLHRIHRNLRRIRRNPQKNRHRDRLQNFHTVLLHDLHGLHGHAHLRHALHKSKPCLELRLGQSWVSGREPVDIVVWERIGKFGLAPVLPLALAPTCNFAWGPENPNVSVSKSAVILGCFTLEQDCTGTDFGTLEHCWSGTETQLCLGVWRGTCFGTWRHFCLGTS